MELYEMQWGDYTTVNSDSAFYDANVFYDLSVQTNCEEKMVNATLYKAGMLMVTDMFKEAC